MIPTTEGFLIRRAKPTDISSMVSLSHQKRLTYEKAQPQFWRHADDAETAQTKWFGDLLAQDDYILLVAESGGQVAGFVIGRLVNAPEVYNPGGLTLMIDDFYVQSPSDWQSFGSKLIEELKLLAKTRGAVQVLIVSGSHDDAKRSFLKGIGLTVASEWYVGDIEKDEVID